MNNSINHNFLDIIGPDQAYFIGLFLTDGCISPKEIGQDRICIELQVTDKNILDKLKNLMDKKNNIRVNKIRKKEGMKNIQATATLDFSSDKISNKLIELGITPKKSMIVSVPKIFIDNEELFSHFLRGCFDGDGSISSYHPKYNYKNINTFYIKELYTFSFIGNYNICNVLSNILYNKYNIGNGKIFKEGNVFRFFIRAKDDLKKLYELIYSNCSELYIDRKFLKFKKFMVENTYLQES